MNPSPLNIHVDGQPRSVEAGTILLAALDPLGPILRYSPSGAPRGAFCAMGVCQECRVTVNGQPGILACMTLVQDGMQVERGR